MKNSVLQAIDRFSLIEKGDAVTVALSGGADSVALLHFMCSLKDELQITVKAAHLNHLIRGDEAKRDEDFVKELCKNMGVELFCERVDIPKIAKERKESIELCARRERYEFFSRIAEGKVATAHTASDNAETLLLNLTRGSGIKGLCGIPPKRDNFIRPLIFCTRQQIEDYCKENQLSFVTDSTNLENAYTRNKLRHKAVPVLRDINANLEDTLTRTVLSLSEDNYALDIMAEELLFKSEADNGLVVLDLKNQPAAIVKRVIIKYVGSLYKDLSLDSLHINGLYDVLLNGGKISLPERLYGICEKGVFSVNHGESTPKKVFKVEISKIPNVNNLFANDCLDCDRIIGGVTVRTRQNGDTIRLKNRGCTKTLNKLFTENKTPVALRDSVPVIADDEGVVWAYEIGVAARVAPTNKTENLLNIKVSVSE